jgi:hypothetical protein
VQSALLGQVLCTGDAHSSNPRSSSPPPLPARPASTTIGTRSYALQEELQQRAAQLGDDSESSAPWGAQDDALVGKGAAPQGDDAGKEEPSSDGPYLPRRMRPAAAALQAEAAERARKALALPPRERRRFLRAARAEERERRAWLGGAGGPGRQGARLVGHVSDESSGETRTAALLEAIHQDAADESSSDPRALGAAAAEARTAEARAVLEAEAEEQQRAALARAQEESDAAGLGASSSSGVLAAGEGEGGAAALGGADIDDMFDALVRFGPDSAVPPAAAPTCLCHVSLLPRVLAATCRCLEASLHAGPARLPAVTRSTALHFRAQVRSTRHRLERAERPGEQGAPRGARSPARGLSPPDFPALNRGCAQRQTSARRRGRCGRRRRRRCGCGVALPPPLSY